MFDKDFSADERAKDANLGRMSLGAYIFANEEANQPTTIRQVLTAEEELSWEAQYVDCR